MQFVFFFSEAIACVFRSTATHYALHASDIALQNAGFKGGCDLDLKRCGVALASGMGSLQDIRDGSHIYNTSPRRLSPFFVSKILISSTAGLGSVQCYLAIFSLKALNLLFKVRLAFAISSRDRTMQLLLLAPLAAMP